MCHPWDVSVASASFADYRAALTAPGAPGPVVASAIGRLPIAMLALATLLYVQADTGSFATGGAVTAGILAGTAIGSVTQGRAMDRFGPTRPLLVVAALFGAAIAALAVAVETEQALPVLVGLALLVGLVHPALEGASRTLWATLVPAGPQRTAAYSYEAISLEVFFILGPAIAGSLVVAAPWPGTALVGAGAAMVAGSVGFALSRAVRATPPRPAGPSVGPLGVLARPGMRTIALAALGFGLVVGSAEVAVLATTAQAGSAALGAVLLSAWSVTSVLSGLLYSRRPWPRPLHLRMPALLGGFAALVAAMALTGPTGSMSLLACVMLLAGALITPQLTGISLAIDVAVPAGTATEAFGWVVTAATLGAAAGQSGAGAVVEAVGPPGAFLVGGAAGAVLTAVLWVRRTTIAPAPAPEPALP
jgi:MFS family permease